LVRFLCPFSCKCGMPRGGLYLDGPTFGCARTKCRQDEHVQKELAKLPCKDESASVLKNDPSWTKFWTNYLDFWGDRSPFYKNMKQKAMAYGCNFHSSHNGDADISFVCDETGAVASVRTWCPITCGCKMKMHPDCPTTCLKYSQPITAGNASVAVARGLIAPY